MGNWIEYSVEEKQARAYFATPASGSGPGIVLCHAWWGLNEFFQELADKLAAEGYTVFAPDLFAGKTTSEIAEAEQLVNSLDWRDAMKHEMAAVDYLLSSDAVAGKRLGVLGFSLGGFFTIMLATIKPEIACVVLFYGGSDYDPEEATQTSAAFLGHFAEEDSFEPLESFQRLEGALQQAGKDVKFYIYPGAGHWFFENNRPDVYKEDDAQLAWQRTLDFLRKHLGS